MENHSRFKTRKEIAEELGISYKTLNRFIKTQNMDLPNGRLLSPTEYTEIYKKFFPSTDQWPKTIL